MFRSIKNEQDDFKKIISEIYKSNVKYLSRVAETTREEQINESKKELELILRAYESLLDEATKVAVDSVYKKIEAMVKPLTAKFKLNARFMTSLIKSEIDVSEEVELNLSDIEISTGSKDFLNAFKNTFNMVYDEGLGDDLIVFKYEDVIKTIDFSNISYNILRDVQSCKKKHLSLIDATKTKA